MHARNRKLYTALVATLLSLSLFGCSSSSGSGGSGGGGGGGGSQQSPLAINAPYTAFAGYAGYSAGPYVVNVYDNGIYPVTFSGNAITLSDSTNFAITSLNCGGTLASGSECLIYVSFTPKSVGAFQTTLSLADTGVSSPQTVLFTGTATVLPVGIATLAPSTLTFPATTPNTSSAPQAITVTNTGTASLSVLGASLSGVSANAFTQTSSCPVFLSVNSSCTILVTFSPATPSASFAATLTIADNSNNNVNGTQTVPLTGTSGPSGPAPQIAFAPSSAAFPNTHTAQHSQPIAITVSNPGTATLNLSAPTITGTAASSFSQTSNCTSTLATNASCTVNITFTPASLGPLAASLSITDNAAQSPQSIPLTGTGVIPQATLNPPSLNFTDVVAGTVSVPQTITLTNGGTEVLTINSIALQGSGLSSFVESNNCGATLAINAACTINASFAPTSQAQQAASIVVNTNAAATSQSISLTATPAANTITHQLQVEPESSPFWLYSLVYNALKTVELTNYQLNDSTLAKMLITDCNRGVRVRVILDRNTLLANPFYYAELNAAGSNCSAAYANPQFPAAREAALVIDTREVAIMTLDLDFNTYNTNRDISVVDNDPNDVAAVEATFNADYGSTTDVNFPAPTGTDLVWSPSSKARILSIINAAQHSLQIETEVVPDDDIIGALEADCSRGIRVQMLIGNLSSNPNPDLDGFQSVCNGLYASYKPTHANFILADYTDYGNYGNYIQASWIGSANLTDQSLTQNRELGISLTDQGTLDSLDLIFTTDQQDSLLY
jgi:phosphatidylserine/phosphatidylglycerophosphate/cardiolipin synthase-like enzyme